MQNIIPGLNPDTFTHWDKRGYYLVGEEKFYCKLAALEQHFKTHKPIKWIFNDAVFGKYDWTTEPQESIQDLYLKRALQLREEYDYLILYYSSGVDSGTILDTFLDNNIHLDEVFTFGAFEAESDSLYKTDDSPGNYTVEIHKEAIPKLKEIKKTNPHLKVTIHDWTNDVISGYKNDDWIYEAGCRFQPNVMARNKFHSLERDHLDLFDKGLKVGHMYGCEKPRVMIDNDRYWFSFLDVLPSTSLGANQQQNQNHWENDEYFYWSPDLPEMLIKQGHIIRNFFNENPHLQYILESGKGSDWHKEQYYKYINRLVFPDWDHNIFQVKKPTGPTYNELDSWFLQDTTTDAFKIWEAGLDRINNILPNEWLNKGDIRNGIVGMWATFYDLGPVKQNIK